jgi:ribonuclease R
MHRLGDVVDVRLVEAAPVAGALRFELLSEGKVMPRGRKREGARSDGAKVQPNMQARENSKENSKAHPGRSPRQKDRRPGKGKPSKSKKGKSWKP